MSEVTQTGHVKWFNEKKGFGFIINSESSEFFVHYKDISGSGFKALHENDFVSFVVEQGPKGLKAKDVLKIAEVAEEMV